jgi:hypothetical protein
MASDDERVAWEFVGLKVSFQIESLCEQSPDHRSHLLLGRTPVRFGVDMKSRFSRPWVAALNLNPVNPVGIHQKHQQRCVWSKEPIWRHAPDSGRPS